MRKPAIKNITAAGLFLLGISAGVWLGWGLISMKGGGMTWVQAFFGRTAVLAGPASDGGFVLSDFEDPAQIKAWKTRSARMAVSAEFAPEGRSSAQVVFEPGRIANDASVSLAGFMRIRGAVSDWSPYGALAFQVHNPGGKEISLLVEVEDIWIHRYKRQIRIPPNSSEEIILTTADIGFALNLKQVDKISISSKAGEPLVFFLDDVRLVPGGISSGLGSVTAQERPLNMLDYLFPARKPAWTLKSPSGETVVSAPFIVKNETPGTCTLWPAEGGFALPAGEVRSVDQIRIRDSRGAEVPSQVRALSFWPDGSVRWAGLHFLATVKPFDGAGYFLEYGALPVPAGAKSSSGLTVEENPDSVVVETGRLRAVFSKRNFFLYRELWADLNADDFYGPQEKMSAEAVLELKFRDETFRTDFEDKTYTLEIEESGPLRAILRAEGWYQNGAGKRFCRAVVRYYLYAGKPQMKVAHTLIYTGYPANRFLGGEEKIKLPENEPLQSFGIRVPFAFSREISGSYLIGTEATPLQFSGIKWLKLFQPQWNASVLETDSGSLDLRAPPAGWLDVAHSGRAMTVALRDFRENFPKAFFIDRDAGEVRVELWPESAGPLNLETTAAAQGEDGAGSGRAFGLGKTHEILLDFHLPASNPADIPEPGRCFRERLLVRMNPFWVDATGALGRLYPAEPKYAREEKALDHLFDWAERQPRNYQWYGMLHFGDTLTAYRSEDASRRYDVPGWHPYGPRGWSNCNGTGTHTGALIQFLRTGAWKYFNFGENLARHIMDIDTVHYPTVAEDPRLAGRIPEELSAVGSMHAGNADHWGGPNEHAGATSAVGLVLYHNVSGDERAREVLREVGEFLLAERFSSFEKPGRVPLKTLANALRSHAALFSLNADRRFFDAANRIAEVLLSGQLESGAFKGVYDPLRKKWDGQAVERVLAADLAGALIAFHELTQAPDVKEALIKLVRYLAGTSEGSALNMHGYAYAYLITGDPFFLARAEEEVRRFTLQVQPATDPLLDGLPGGLPAYDTPNVFLSSTPYVFGALEEGFARYLKKERSARGAAGRLTP